MVWILQGLAAPFTSLHPPFQVADFPGVDFSLMQHSTDVMWEAHLLLPAGFLIQEYSPTHKLITSTCPTPCFSLHCLCGLHQPLPQATDFPGVDFSLVQHSTDVMWEALHAAQCHDGGCYLTGEEESHCERRALEFYAWLLDR